MPTVFILSHIELVSLTFACRVAAEKERAFAAAQTSVATQHIHLRTAEHYERQAQRFASAAENQELMWKIHRKG
jgi:hypothetical protein